MAIEAQFPSWGSQDWMDSSGCGGFNQFYINLPQLQQQHQHQQYKSQVHNLQQQCNAQQLQNLQQQGGRSQNLSVDNSFIVPSSSSTSPFKQKNCMNGHHQSMSYPQSTGSSLFEKQRQEIDHYIRLQNERFRLLLQEQRRQQTTLLLRKIESKAGPLLRQKEEEIAQATKRKMELEEFLKRLEVESQAWQRAAQENEAMVISLNNTIEQLRENVTSCCNDDGGAGDAESCCDVNRQQEEGKKTGEDWNRKGFHDDHNNNNVKDEATAAAAQGETLMMMKMPCKRCRSRNSCILFLPCRHLCSCKACESFLDSCPVCQTAKKASIEAIMV